MGPNKVGVSLPSPEDGSGSNFRNVVFSIHLEFRTMAKVHKPSDCEGFFNFHHALYSLLASLRRICDTRRLKCA
jgi:hypothetical protein